MLLTFDVCDESWSGPYIRVTHVDCSVGMAEVYLDENALGARLYCQVIVRLVYELTRRTSRACEEDYGAAVSGQIE